MTTFFQYTRYSAARHSLTMKLIGGFTMILFLLTLANPVEAAPTDEVVRHRDQVNANTTDVYRLTFEAGKTVAFTIDGDGDTDLDLYIYDENDNLIASDDDLTDYCLASVTMSRTGQLRIEIVNLGDVYNEYVMTIETSTVSRASSGSFSLASSSQIAPSTPDVQTHYDRVEANTSDIYMLTFQAGVQAGVALQGDGDTDLDLYIYDENDNLIASDEGLTDNALVEWTPSWTGRYRIEIRNLGSVYNAYQMFYIGR